MLPYTVPYHTIPHVYFRPSLGQFVGLLLSFLLELRLCVLCRFFGFVSCDRFLTRENLVTGFSLRQEARQGAAVEAVKPPATGPLVRVSAERGVGETPQRRTRACTSCPVEHEKEVVPALQPQNTADNSVVRSGDQGLCPGVATIKNKVPTYRHR